MAAKQLSDGGPDGTVLGQSATDKIAFFGETPVAQQAAITACTNTTTTTSTTGALTTDVDDLRRAVNDIITALQNVGITA